MDCACNHNKAAEGGIVDPYGGLTLLIVGVASIWLAGEFFKGKKR